MSIKDELYNNSDRPVMNDGTGRPVRVAHDVTNKSKEFSYLGGKDNWNKSRARKCLEHAELAMIPCYRCIAANVDCYKTDEHGMCAFCMSGGVGRIKCRPFSSTVSPSTLLVSSLKAKLQSPAPSLVAAENLVDTLAVQPVPESAINIIDLEFSEQGTKTFGISKRGVKQESVLSSDQEIIEPIPSKRLCKAPEIIFRFLFPDNCQMPPVDELATDYGTTESFFDEAFRVWSSRNTPVHREWQMYGVEVAWDEPERSSTVRWRNQSDYVLLMSRVQRARPDKYGEVVVKVKCVKSI
ncbi:hypothetical protein MMC13_002129 [Lambiella insularis]|nr:hypothetical protein [Lambiella insularis]